MLVYSLRRILAAIPVLLAASLLVFLLIDSSGDPLFDMRIAEPPVPPEVIQAQEERLYLDRSTPERYWLWLTGIGGNGDVGLLQGKFGPSTRGTTYDIGTQIGQRLIITLRLVLAAAFLALVLGVVAGVLSAVRQYSKTDHTVTFVAFVALAMPIFWLAALAKEGGTWFNQQLGTRIFFTLGASTPGGPRTAHWTWWDHFTDVAGHMVLPTLVLCLSGFAVYSRWVRGSMLEVLNSDYVRLARAKGLRHNVVMRRHALRTSLIPLTTVAVVGIVGLIDGAVLTETVFQWRGLGRFFVESVQARDAYAVMGFLMLSGALVIIANLIADLLYGVLDPRIRYE
jgi:peptide/nickel transport system permease protein